MVLTAASRFLVTVAALLLTLPGSADAAPVPTPKLDRIVLVGDSLAVEATPYLRFFQSGKRFVDRSFGGTAPCDWSKGSLPMSRSTAVVVSFTGNALTSCMRDRAGHELIGEAKTTAYRKAVEQIIRRARGVRAWVILVGQPARPADVAAGSFIDVVNEMYRDLAEHHDRVAFVDAGAGVELDDGSYAGYLACLPFEPECGPDGTNQVRGDGVHFCPVWGSEASCPVYSSGALRFALGISAAIDDPHAHD